MTTNISACIEKIIKIGVFLCRYFNIGDGRKAKFPAYYLLVLKGKSSTEMQETFLHV